MVTRTRLLVVLLSVVFTTSAIAQVDTTPPVLISFTASPLAFDTATGDAVLTLCVEAQDDLSGVELVRFLLLTGCGADKIASIGFPPDTRDASGCSTITIPQFTAYKVYGIALQLDDRLGNRNNYQPRSDCGATVWPDSCDFGPCHVENRASSSVPDTDGDGVADDADNCPNDPNPDQSDRDTDLIGDVCDPFPDDRDNEQAQCEADLAACLAGSSPDADGDGEANATDRCPSTPAGQPVDDAGCSLAQFCAVFDAPTPEGKRACKKADWRNDEPLMKGKEVDCVIDKGGRGTGDDRCVPAFTPTTTTTTTSSSLPGTTGTGATLTTTSVSTTSDPTSSSSTFVTTSTGSETTGTACNTGMAGSCTGRAGCSPGSACADAGGGCGCVPVTTTTAP